VKVRRTVVEMRRMKTEGNMKYSLAILIRFKLDVEGTTKQH